MRRIVVRACSWLAAMCLLWTVCRPAQACFYGERAFDPEEDEQTDVAGLLAGRYDVDPKKERAQYGKDLELLQGELESRRGDSEFMDRYALDLFRTGKHQEAQKVWADLLKAEPDRFVTLSNAGSAYHQLQQLDLAKPLIEKAAQLRPEFRNGAERWHLRMIEYLSRIRKDPGYGGENLFIEELTPVWRGHRAGSEIPDLPVEISSEGIAELLREYPKFGDGWLVLGLILEAEGDPYTALRAYERALKVGTAQRQRLEGYLREFRQVAKTDDPGTKAVRGAVWAGSSLAVIVLLLIAYRFGSAIWADIRESRENKGRGRKPPR